MNLKVGNDTGEGIEISIEEGRVYVKGMWKGRLSKSKKGNWNQSWHSEKLFEEICRKYLKGEKEPEPEEPEEVPF